MFVQLRNLLIVTEAKEKEREPSPDPEITIKKNVHQPPLPKSKSINGTDSNSPQVNGDDKKDKSSIKKPTADVYNKSTKTAVSSRLDESSRTLNSSSNKRKRLRDEVESADRDTKASKISKPIPSSTNSSTKKSASLNNNLSNNKRGPKRKLNNSNASTTGPPAKKSKTTPAESADETTYVLPANLSEWGKLFEMVKSTMDSGTLSGNRTGTAEAKALLKNQTKITSLPLEEQVHIFNRLCSLANIQVD